MSWGYARIKTERLGCGGLKLHLVGKFLLGISVWKPQANPWGFLLSGGCLVSLCLVKLARGLGVAVYKLPKCLARLSYKNNLAEYAQGLSK